jgi:hypothetical protein
MKTETKEDRRFVDWAQVNGLVGELDSLTWERKAFMSGIGICEDSMNVLRAKIDSLESENKKLKDALECYFYAYTPNGHNAPEDCFFISPKIGDAINGLVACPGCEADFMRDIALSTTESQATQWMEEHDANVLEKASDKLLLTDPGKRWSMSARFELRRIASELRLAASKRKEQV